MFKRAIALLASLQLTVALLALSMGLIFAGTLAQARMGIWEVVAAYFRSPIAWIDLQMFLPEALARLPWQVPYPGGAVLGALILINLLAAHLVRFRFQARRVGVLILHAGLLVLLAGEFVTARFADEGLMSIDVGGQASHVEDVRTSELVLLEHLDEKTDRVYAIPEAFVTGHAEAQTRLSDPKLPVELEILQWIPNARLLHTHDPTLADRGVGLDARPEALPRARGADGAQTDAPAAYVRLHRAGETLGTWLLSAHLIHAQRFEIEGQAYSLALRYRRTYLPFTLHLEEFRHDRFTGTQIPRNFSSRVQLIDPETGTDRQVLIWMNHPLRYRGATFYQASYKPDGSGTVLQVVRNPGAFLPYLACALVGGGMLLHFGWGMTSFLQRWSTRQARSSAHSLAPPVPLWQRALPTAAGALGVALACSNLMRPLPASDHDLATFGRLPVSAGGRIKPMDSAARHALMVAGGRQSVKTDAGTVPATQYLLDLMARPEAIRHLPAVRVDHPDVLALIERSPEAGGRLPLAAIEPHWQIVIEQATAALEIDSKRRDPFQRAVIQLFHAVSTLIAHARMQEPYAIPPTSPEGSWQPFHDAFLASGLLKPEDHPTGPADLTGLHPAVAYYVAMMTAYSEGNAEGFNQSVRGYEALLRRDMPGVLRKAQIEVLFNRAAPFLGAAAVYVLAAVLLCLAMLLRSWHTPGQQAALAPALRQSAVGLIVAAMLVQTAAILLRIYLQGRPPVTNLYSSAVFVGWAAALLGLFLERLYPLGLAALGAATIGFTTLIVAHNLGSDGDTLQMMQAVLDSNFWLATHVITITLGYSATFLAGTLGIGYLLLGLFTRRLTTERAEALTRMVYGTVCFALLLSFVGTVLGGIWADQSWGRFWGWDPKENGAALVVLIHAIILHARWGGMIRQRGMMVLAVAGNIVTAWSWFGTNMLGIGLHAYGFMESAVFWLLLFVFSQLVLIGLGLLPHEAWRSDPRRVRISRNNMPN